MVEHGEEAKSEEELIEWTDLVTIERKVYNGTLYCQVWIYRYCLLLSHFFLQQGYVSVVGKAWAEEKGKGRVCVVVEFEHITVACC